MNKSLNVYTDNNHDILGTVRQAFPDHKVIENGSVRDVPVNGDMKPLQTITIVDCTSEVYQKGKRGKSLRTLKKMGFIRNW